MDKALAIAVRHERDYTVVTAAGEIDISTVTQLRERLLKLAASDRPLLADLDQVTFIDASGFNALVAAANRAATHGGSVHVVCARPRIRELFCLAGLDDQILLARTRDEARETLAAATHPHPDAGIVAARPA